MMGHGVISALGKLRRKNLEFNAQPGLHSETLSQKKK
jgi:hypothetical protein